MISNACGQRTPQKKSKWFSSVLHGDQKYFEKMYYIFVIPNDAIQYVYKKIAFKFIMK